MRELLLEVYDRLGEVYWGRRDGEAGECVGRLRDDLSVVLDAGYFDGSYLALDLRQMPEVL